MNSDQDESLLTYFEDSSNFLPNLAACAKLLSRESILQALSLTENELQLYEKTERFPSPKLAAMARDLLDTLELSLTIFQPVQASVWWGQTWSALTKNGQKRSPAQVFAEEGSYSLRLALHQKKLNERLRGASRPFPYITPRG